MNISMRKRNQRRFYVIIISIVTVMLCISLANKKAAQNIPAVNQMNALQYSGKKDEFTVCIDPGHGEFDDGTTGISGVKEKDINLNVALKVGKILEKSKCKVIYTRTTDEVEGSTQKEELQRRCDKSNKAGSDVYISIHCNFDEVSPKTRGMEVWCRFPKENGEKLALSVEEQLAKIGYTKDRGLKYESYGGKFVLKNTNSTAVLVELGFLSNKEDSSFLESEKGQDKCADSIAKAILDYAGIIK